MKTRIFFSLLLTFLLTVGFLVNPASADNSSLGPDEETDSTESLETTALYDTTLIAVDVTYDEDFPAANPRAGYFSAVRNSVYISHGTLTNDKSNHIFTKAQIIGFLQSSNILFLHSHGSAGSIQISINNPMLLYNYDLSSVSLSNLQCVVFLSCKSGKYVPSTTSMVQTMVNRGATCAVGFDVDISVDDANRFATRFAERTMEYGYNVNDAVIYMSMYNMNDPYLNTETVIGGNSSIALN